MSFSIFHKPSTIVVDAFTHNQSVHDFFPIERASEFVPKWFKEMSSQVDVQHGGLVRPVPTMKACSGIVKTFSTSFILPFWEELIMRSRDSEIEWLSSSKESDNTGFSHFQKANAFLDVAHMKMNSKWKLSDKSGIDFLLTQPYWTDYNHHSNFSWQVTPGIVEFKHQKQLNVNIVLPNTSEQVTIVAGEPILQIYPLTEKRVVIKNHLVSYEEYLKVGKHSSYQHSFVSKYKKTIAMRKKRGLE